MAVLLLLILASLAIAALFLGGFIWAVRAGQFEDTCTPSMRLLAEESTDQKQVPGQANKCTEPGKTRLVGSTKVSDHLAGNAKSGL